MTRHQAPCPKAPERPVWSLDYEKYPAPELRTFIEARIGTTLSKKERRTIANCNKSQLAKRLHKLDLAITFPRFMELPPELHLGVCELLLVDTRERDQDGLVKDQDTEPDNSNLHPAVLRTSKQICAEARPILYQKNKFSAGMVYSMKTPHWSVPVVGCFCIVMRPGKMAAFFQRMFTSRHSLALSRLFGHPVMGMLRSLTHLTIKLSLVTLGDHESDSYVPKARNAIASLCLSLTGASKMQELTIDVNVDPKRPQRSKVDFARILWPLVFLRTDIVVKFEGITEILKTSTAVWPGNSHAEASYGRHIAKTRHLCIQGIENQGRNVVGLRGVEAAVASMNCFGDEFVSMDDILNLSAAWTGMRSEGDRVEAVGLKEWDLLRCQIIGHLCTEGGPRH